MWIALLLMLMMAGMLVAVVWPAIKPSARAGTAKSTTTADAEPVTRPASLEGALVVQLSGGAITRGQYLRAMEQLAARDEVRHPLSVPSDSGPDKP